jgi:hypothetical protein
MQTLMCSLIKLTCLRHGIELQTNTLQSMQTRFGEHVIGLKDQLPTIKFTALTQARGEIGIAQAVTMNGHKKFL